MKGQAGGGAKRTGEPGSERGKASGGKRMGVVEERRDGLER